MYIRSLPPLEVLRDLYIIDRNSPSGLSQRRTGKPVGTYKVKKDRPDARPYVEVRGKRYFTYRIVFALYHGRDTTLQIDHIDGNPRNNLIENLREATDSQNKRNVGARSNTPHGTPGVYRERNGVYSVRFYNEGKLRRFGRFRDVNKARVVAVEIRQMLHGDFACRHAQVEQAKIDYAILWAGDGI